MLTRPKVMAPFQIARAMACLRSALMVSLEELDLALVLLRRLQGLEGPEIPAPTGSRIPLDGEEPIFTRVELPDHRIPRGRFVDLLIVANAAHARYREGSVPCVGSN